MKTKTPFYELAERIGNDTLNDGYGICNDLRNEDCKVWFQNLFKPTMEEIIDYGMSSAYWAEQSPAVFPEDNEFRVTLLLFADLLWQEEMKGGKK